MAWPSHSSSRDWSAALVHGAACSARSGPQTTPLVELYHVGRVQQLPAGLTSGCLPRSPKTVPQARGLRSRFTSTIGTAWAGRIALPHRPIPNGNTRECVRIARASSHTPQVLVQGRDFPQWQSGAVRPALAARWREAGARRDNARSSAGSADRSRSRRRAGAICRRRPQGAVLYVALADDGLASDVKAGENAGVRLVHDHVVRLFRAGPALDANGDVKWSLHASACLPERATRRRSSRSSRTRARRRRAAARWRCRLPRRDALGAR